MLHSVEYLKEALELDFPLDDDFIDSLRSHEANCYIAANRGAMVRVVEAAPTRKEFYQALLKVVAEAEEDFPVSREISDGISMDISDMVYAYDKGVQKEAAVKFAEGGYWQDIIF